VNALARQRQDNSASASAASGHLHGRVRHLRNCGGPLAQKRFGTCAAASGHLQFSISDLG
jgi:hypothetical protein